MAFVNDAGRCLHRGAGRTKPNVRNKGVSTCLGAFTAIDIFKKHPLIQRVRSGTYNIGYFLRPSMRGRTLLRITHIIVSELIPQLLNCLCLVFIHLKLEFLTQIPAANDENILYLRND